MRFSLIATALGAASAAIAYPYSYGSGEHWVDTWAAMPQLTEYANLPTPPFVSPATTSRVLPWLIFPEPNQPDFPGHDHSSDSTLVRRR